METNQICARNKHGCRLELKAEPISSRQRICKFQSWTREKPACLRSNPPNNVAITSFHLIPFSQRSVIGGKGRKKRKGRNPKAGRGGKNADKTHKGKGREKNFTFRRIQTCLPTSNKQNATFLPASSTGSISSSQLSPLPSHHFSWDGK